MSAATFFNAHHSPLGAFASLTLGEKGRSGGLGLELGAPARQNVFIGIESRSGGRFDCLPFFEPVEDESVRFAPEARRMAQRGLLRMAPDRGIRRSYGVCTDTWAWGDATLTIHSPAGEAPDPERTRPRKLSLAYLPALAIEFTVDNRAGRRPRRAFFGFQNENPQRAMRRLHELGRGPEGIAASGNLALATDSPGVVAAQSFTVEDILVGGPEWNRGFGLGGVGLLHGTVPPGERQTWRILAAFYRGAIVTTGLEASYYYTRFFSNLEAVVSYGLAQFEAVKARGKGWETELANLDLPADRSWMLAHAVRSYMGSTQLLLHKGQPLWVVNEGEYRMINTLDLTADHAFYEAKRHPWTLRNTLDFALQRYSYSDRLRCPKTGQEVPGGISFAHDMGVANHFAPPGRSIYEKAGTDGCFSHMTSEQLVNWIHVALVYFRATGDRRWVMQRAVTLKACLRSLVRRDAVLASARDGIPSLDSSRCEGGAEITTYDSLDASLGQARENLYLGGRCWAVYLGLADLFTKLHDQPSAELSADQAARAARRITAAADPSGRLPAILGGDPGTAIIPVVEGLALAGFLGLDETLRLAPHAALVSALDAHLRLVLADGSCRFPEGGWKLSSTSDNSWLSKIYLCQAAAESVLGHEPDRRADHAHRRWLLDPANTPFAWSDQMIRGKASGSKYYPRGVTAILWTL